VADQSQAVGLQGVDDRRPVGGNDAVVGHGGVHGQLQIIEAHRGDQINLFEYR